MEIIREGVVWGEGMQKDELKKGERETMERRKRGEGEKAGEEYIGQQGRAQKIEEGVAWRERKQKDGLEKGQRET